jgi:hypothetical protein
MTHTVTQMRVSPLVYAEISQILQDAGYSHVFHAHSEGPPMLDMTGIGIIQTEQTPLGRELAVSLVDGVDVGRKVRHHTGRIYRVVGTAWEDDLCCDMVILRGLHDGRLWVRTHENFKGVSRGNIRFTYMDE